MSDRIHVLTDLRNQALADARKIVDDAEAAGRHELDAEEEHRYSQFMADWEKYDAAIRREKAIAEREALASEEREAFAAAPAPAAEPATPSFESWLLDAVRGKGEYHAEVWVGPEQGAELKPEVRSMLGRELRTDYPLTTTDASTTYSSYTVPAQVAATIEEKKYAYSAVLQAGANVWTTEGINTLYVPKVVTNPTINLGTQAAAPTDTSYPVLGRTTLGGYRCDAIVVISEEEIASASVDMMGFLNRLLAGSVAARVASYLAVGTGSSQPQGIFVGATTGATAASATTFTADEVIAAYQSVGAEYRAGLRAVISQAAESLLSRLKTDEGNYIWRSGLAAGNPDTLLGVPLFTDPQGPGLTTGKKPLVFYNPDNFHVRWAMGGRVMYDVTTSGGSAFRSFTREIRVAQWMDCAAGDAGGCKSLTLA